MLRRTLPVLLLVAALAACSKKTDPSAPGGSNPDAPTYTLKLKEDAPGDMILYTEVTNRSMSSTVSGPMGKKTDAEKGVDRIEYTEAIFERTPGSDRATKFTRDYKTDEDAPEGGPAKRASYVGKTVTFEKKGGRYSITVEGKPLPKDEDEKFRKSLEKPDGLTESDMLPKKPVAVNETWELDAATIAKFSGDFPFPVDKAKSSGSGKLITVYSKGGKQWAVMEHNLKFVIDGDNGGMKMSGTMMMSATLDAIVDGSSHEGVMKMKASATISAKGRGVEMELAIEADGVETRTPVK